MLNVTKMKCTKTNKSIWLVSLYTQLLLITVKGRSNDFFSSLKKNHVVLCGNFFILNNTFVTYLPITWRIFSIFSLQKLGFWFSLLSLLTRPLRLFSYIFSNTKWYETNIFFGRVQDEICMSLLLIFNWPITSCILFLLSGPQTTNDVIGCFNFRAHFV